MAVSLILILLLLLFSALLTGAEVDYFGSDTLEKQKLSKSKSNRKVLENLGKPEKIMGTIMIANLVTNVAIIMLSIFFAARIPNLDHSSVSVFILLVLIVTTAILLFGEILPRLYATRYPWQTARIMAYPLSFLEKVFSPLNFVFIYFTSLVNKRLKKKSQKNISVDEISQALELASEVEVPEEKEILEGIVNFGSKNVSEIMCPRIDVVTVDIKSLFRTVLDVINESGYSRIPVFDESFDHVTGILYIKDLLPHTEKGDNFPWQKLLRPPFFVPETRKVKDLLEDFQKNKIHMAIVVDEYGGSSGIVTLEDVLEEIVGDIADEFDQDETFFTRIGEKKYIFDGKTMLDKFIGVVGCDPEYFAEVRGEADTLAGLILEINGDIPRFLDKIDYKDFHFTIESVTNRRIEKVKVEVT